MEHPLLGESIKGGSSSESQQERTSRTMGYRGEINSGGGDINMYVYIYIGGLYHPFMVNVGMVYYCFNHLLTTGWWFGT